MKKKKELSPATLLMVIRYVLLETRGKRRCLDNIRNRERLPSAPPRPQKTTSSPPKISAILDPDRIWLPT